MVLNTATKYTMATMNTSSSIHLDSSNSSFPITLVNDSCTSLANTQKETISLLRHHQKDITTTKLTNTLINYIISTMDQNFPSSLNSPLTPTEIDDIVGQLNTNVIISTTHLFIMVVSPNENKDIVIGVSFQSNLGGQLIQNSNQHQIINSKISAAAIISLDSLVGITHLNMLVIDKPTYYNRFNTSINKKIISSIIVTKVQRNKSSSDRMNISLYFTKQTEYIINNTSSGNFVCSYYNTSTLSWDESGCTLPLYNFVFNRYECSCNHLTTFALLYTIDDSLSTSHSTLESTISTLNKISTDTPSLETSTSSSDTETPMTKDTADIQLTDYPSTSTTVTAADTTIVSTDINNIQSAAEDISTSSEATAEPNTIVTDTASIQSTTETIARFTEETLESTTIFADPTIIQSTAEVISIPSEARAEPNTIVTDTASIQSTTETVATFTEETLEPTTIVTNPTIIESTAEVISIPSEARAEPDTIVTDIASIQSTTETIGTFTEETLEPTIIFTDATIIESIAEVISIPSEATAEPNTIVTDTASIQSTTETVATFTEETLESTTIATDPNIIESTVEVISIPSEARAEPNTIVTDTASIQSTTETIATFTEETLELTTIFTDPTITESTANGISIPSEATAEPNTIVTDTASTQYTTETIATFAARTPALTTIVINVTSIEPTTGIISTSLERTAALVTIVTDATSIQATTGITTTVTKIPEILVETYNSDFCNDSSLVPWINGTCVLIGKAQNDAVDRISNYTENNTTELTQLLTIYYATIARDKTSLTSDKRLSVAVIDDTVGKLKNAVVISANTSFIMSIPPNRGNDTVIGGLFKSGSYGKYILSSNYSNITDSSFTAAAVFDKYFLTNVTDLNLFILDTPNDARLFNDSRNRTLVSPVIVANPRKSDNHSMSVTLYFTNQTVNFINITGGKFLCAYYDTKTSSWEDKDCSAPTLNSQFNAYECNCTHLTSFGLIWLPPGSSDSTLRAVDIVSLVTQFISIICFVALIIHSIATRVRTPRVKLQSTYLLPLISCASTVCLFIFFIALVLTVYTKAQSLKTNTCFTSATILMFFVYFLLFFMFCTKTCISYFNYIHFVRLFPPPSLKILGILLIISFIISMTAVAFGIGFNSKSSSGIIEIHGKKICWFKEDVINYFMTIPIGIFVLINVIIFILIVKRMINHARNATSPHQSYQRMKKSALLLIASSITQGIGWLIGPVLRITKIGDIFEWIFVISIGLEGLWLILLYIIIKKQHIDEEQRVVAARELMKMKNLRIKKDKQINNDYTRTKNNLKQRSGEIVFRSPRRDL